MNTTVVAVATTPASGDNVTLDENLVRVLIEAVRARSQEEQLASEPELRTALSTVTTGATLPEASATSCDVDLPALIAAAVALEPELQCIQSTAGENLYFITSLMSRSFAEILAAKSTPHLQMAQEIRRSSKLYPRTIPLDLFEYPPFSMGVETVQLALKTMAEDQAFSDITFATSSVGTVYLFSTDYIDRDYGEFLAEHADINSVLSP